MTPFRVLYLDMNCFFASVEQQLDPALRGRPVAITAVDSDSGACVAASYEAKAHGVRTGTHVRDAVVFAPVSSSGRHDTGFMCGSIWPWPTCWTVMPS